ncbi:BatD family protein [Tautonia plasticadhaerens]|uniref:Oxygen tolerance n=1 Tax=Tautonia plasticadhaerens TaxID=2527974 RepID=A0A518HB15_9BACT|nr:BatD family protein [Tautonia plasticadhaerens]QDV38055.1 hypothetical protein ElP_60030 [Tautonia plasticadhaerens]
MAVVLAVAPGPSTAAGQAEGLPVRVEASTRGPHYVGQAIPFRVLVTAGATEPTVEAPTAPELDVIPATVEVRPVSASSIGTIVQETNLYRFTYFLVPRRAGPMLVPAFRARADGRSGASGPTRLEPKLPPSEGRPSWFLGGIGPLEVGVVARPGATRLGESAVVEVTLDGPGALGSTNRPTLRLGDGSEDGAAVEPMPPRSSDSPPSRTFPFRVRPGSAGTTTIEPVLVSWFDPGSRSYRTVGSGGVSLRVEDPPGFDPSAIEVASVGEEPRARGPGDRLGAALAAIGAAGSAGVLSVLAWGWGRRRRRSPGRFARRQAARIEAADAPTRAGLVSEALAGYLSRAIGHPGGELTPPEARGAIGLATGDPGLADRAARLVEACDTARYSGRAGGGTAWGMRRGCSGIWPG